MKVMEKVRKVLEKNLRLWQRKLLGWKLFVFMQVSFCFSSAWIDF